MKRRESKRWIQIATALTCAAMLLFALFFAMRELGFRRPHLKTAKESGTQLSLVYAVMKAESGFDESAVSSAGAVGLMQLMPATAEFTCRLNELEFDAEKLKEGEYNLRLGCLYLNYLLGRFEVEATAIAAYNAGEGTVSEWLKNRELSPDGKSLNDIPFPETAHYVKKVEKFRKIYQFFYH